MTPARSAALSGRTRIAGRVRGADAMGRARVMLAPLVRSSTYRGGVFLLLGAVVLLPYVLVGAAFVQMLTGDVARAPVVVLLALTAIISVTPAFLRPTRALEIHAVRGLLDIDLPDPPTPAPTGRSLQFAWNDWQNRVATATWYALHLLAGGVLATVLFALLPLVVVYGLMQLGIAPGGLVTESDLGFLGGAGGGWLTLLAGGVCVGTIYLTAGLGAGLARLAPVLLGPSAAERVAALEARATDLAERNRLARELHDSVGHALTVTTLQAAAARTVLDGDPAFVRQALAAIEDAGRAAMADLDHVLGLLRAADSEPTAQSAPQPTLAALHRLIADSGPAGLAVDLEVTGSLADVPAGVSREGYRIVQESLTNALRHGDGGVARVRLTVGGSELAVEVRNPAGTAPGDAARTGSGDDQLVRGGDAGGQGRAARAGSGHAEPARAADTGGRGLAGMRERVRLLRGTMSAGWVDGEWVVTARLPFDPGAVSPP